MMGGSCLPLLMKTLFGGVFITGTKPWINTNFYFSDVLRLPVTPKPTTKFIVVVIVCF